MLILQVVTRHLYKSLQTLRTDRQNAGRREALRKLFSLMGLKMLTSLQIEGIL